MYEVVTNGSLDPWNVIFSTKNWINILLFVCVILF
jgi:hypothetical protein